MKNQVIRAYIRIHHTPPPPRETSEAESEKLGMFLMMVINRQWTVQSKGLMRFVAQTGNQEPIIRQQVRNLYQTNMH